ncbi:hypothetical protein DFH09DRAFT_606835 [Mycena vulgaris]|nr:hypothetical protein DFH09DRAFT_606835 [Mycena vulgaris]
MSMNLDQRGDPDAPLLGSYAMDLPAPRQYHYTDDDKLSHENLQQTRSGTFVIYSPDNEKPDANAGSLDSTILTSDPGIGGCSISVHEPVEAVTWIENNWEHPLVTSVQENGCGGPFALMLLPTKPALALFGSYDDPFVTNAAQSLATLSRFPVMIRPSSDNPMNTLPRGTCLGNTSERTQLGGPDGARNHEGHGDGSDPTDIEIFEDGGTAGSVDEGGQGGDDGDHDRMGFDEDDPNGQTVHDQYPNHRGGYRGDNGGGDDGDGGGGPPTTEDKWESPLHGTRLKLRLKLNATHTYAIAIGYNFKFQITQDSDLPIDLEHLTRPLSQPEVVALVDFEIETRPREAQVDRSYANIGFVAHREESIMQRKFLHRGFDLPDKLYKRGQQQQIQRGLVATLGISSGTPVGTAAFSYTRNRGVTLEATDSKVMPRCRVDYEIGDEWDEDSKSYTSYNIAYQPQDLRLDADLGHLHPLEVKVGMGINLRPSGSEKPLPKISFINRNQVLIWVSDPTSKARVRGIVVLMSSYLDNIRAKEKLSIYEHEDIDLMNAGILNPRETKQEEHKPGTISVSIANVQGQAAPNASRFGAALPAFIARLGQGPPAAVLDIPPHEYLARGWDATNNRWRSVLWPALDHNFRAAELERTSPVWKIGWKVAQTTAAKGKKMRVGREKGKGKE